MFMREDQDILSDEDYLMMQELLHKKSISNSIDELADGYSKGNLVQNTEAGTMHISDDKGLHKTLHAATTENDT